MKHLRKYIPILLIVLISCSGQTSDEEVIPAPEGPAFIMFYTDA